MNSRLAALFVIVLGILSGQVLASESSSYAGEETRGIKALPQSQISGLLSGKGMGYGKAAELNGYPGPAHVLELAKELSLTTDQQADTEAIFAKMEDAAKELGAELVAAERALDQAFQDRVVDEASVLQLVQAIGEVESRLRAVHLNAHLQQAQLLDDKQISNYMSLRGYHRNEHESHHTEHSE